MSKERTQPRYVRFPVSVDRFLGDYAAENGFGSEVELVRHIVREFKRKHETQTKQHGPRVLAEKPAHNHAGGDNL